MNNNENNSTLAFATTKKNGLYANLSFKAFLKEKCSTHFSDTVITFDGREYS